MAGHDLSHITYTGTGHHSQSKVGVLVSKWNPEITEVLYEGVERTLKAAGMYQSHIHRLTVPGSYELPSAANILLHNQPDLEGIIALGCVIQGETRHFEFICQAVSQGLVQVSVKFNKPVIFGVLTPDTQQQAKDRAGGKYGNKGEEAAVAFLEMMDLTKRSKEMFPL
ncbi:MAG: 6,7-dimethyl-8-ribityllumazine synthase [Bacteroidota bacterium]